MSKSTFLPTMLLLINGVLGSAGQLLMKYGATKLHPIQSTQGFAASLLDSFRGIFTPYVFMGFMVYGLSSILWMRIIRQVPLSFAYPMVSISYVLVVVSSKLIFGDKINVPMSAGLLLICLGVTLIGVGYGGAVK